MIIAAVVCAALASHAAAYDWKTSTTGKIYEAGSTTTYSGMAYLFADAGTTTQALIFDALAAGKDIATLGSLDSASISAGAIKAKTDKFTYDGNITAFFAIVDGDSFFIGPTASATAADVGSSSISFNAKNASQAAAFTDVSTYQGAGWYTAVPEPTSGLLLLLGMAGLALKRKQA